MFEFLNFEIKLGKQGLGGFCLAQKKNSNLFSIKKCFVGNELLFFLLFGNILSRLWQA
jgi:hypothetical protein